jgi:single-strand DNA-binding protein
MANLNFNKVILGGRLTADPALKTTPSGVSVTTFTLAVNRRFGGKNGEETQADFINVTAWRQTAEFITRYFRKGASLLVVGTVQSRSWTDQAGQKHFATEVVADEAYFVDSKTETVQVTAPGTEAYDAARAQAAAAQAQAPKFEEIRDDEDLPF